MNGPTNEFWDAAGTALTQVAEAVLEERKAVK